MAIAATDRLTIVIEAAFLTLAESAWNAIAKTQVMVQAEVGDCETIPPVTLHEIFGLTSIPANPPAGIWGVAQIVKVELQ